MASPGLSKRETVSLVGMAILSWAYIWANHRWPGTPGTVVLHYLWQAWFLVWIGSKIWMGYRRRQPYWTRESWLRYLRLVAMPVVALILLFTELYFFDNTTRGFPFGSPQSATRAVWIVIDLALMGCGVVGLMMAIDWLERGEPSELFTRTRWFRRRGTSPIAD